MKREKLDFMWHKCQ